MTQNNSRFSRILPTKSSKAVFSVLLIALLTLSAFFVLYTPKAGIGVSAQPNFLNVAISGPQKLGVNEVGTFVASVNNSYSGNLVYSWSISPVDNNTVMVSDGSSCNLTFVQATENAYSLSVSVKDSTVGNMGATSIAVYDPYTSPGYKFDASTATASYIISTDGLGWYQAVRGLDGAVMTSWTSTDLTSVVTNVDNSFSSSGGKVAFAGGSYTFTSPVNLGNTHTNIWFDGQGGGNLGWPSSNWVGATQFYASVGLPEMFNLSYTFGCQFSNIYFNVSGTTNIINLWSTQYTTIQQNTFIVSNGDAIYEGIATNTEPVGYWYDWRNTIENNNFKPMVNGVCIAFQGDVAAAAPIETNLIHGNYLEGQVNLVHADTCIGLWFMLPNHTTTWNAARIDSMIVSNNIIENMKTGIMINAVDACLFTDNQFGQNNIWDINVTQMSNANTECSFINNQKLGASYDFAASNILYLAVGANSASSLPITPTLGIEVLFQGNNGISDNVPTTTLATVANTVTIGQVMYYNGTNSQYYLAKADSNADMGTTYAVALATQGIAATHQCNLVTQGYYTYQSWSWTIGGNIYVSASTAGGLTQTAPSGAGNVIEYVGYAVSATTIYFNPQPSNAIVHS